MSHGALYLNEFAVGKTITPGTPAVGTRRVYLSGADLGDNRESTDHEFDTGDLNRIRAVTLGPTQAGGSASLITSADALVEWGLVGLQGGVTPTTPAGATLNRLWSFVPTVARDSLTLARNDAARLFQLTDTQVDQFTFTGDVTGTASTALQLFATDYITLGAFPSVAQYDYRLSPGHKLKFYVDPGGTTNWGTTIAPTNIPGTLMNYSIVVGLGMQRVYTGDDTLAANAVVPVGITAEATFTFKAAAAAVPAELTAYTNETRRLVRVEQLGPLGEAGMDAATQRLVHFDMAGQWTARTLSGASQAVRTYEFKLRGLYDSVVAFAFRMRLTNARLTAF